MTDQAYITRMASVLPNAPVDNAGMEAVLGQVGGRPSRARANVLRSNGIQSRHYVFDPQTGLQTHSNAQQIGRAHVRTPVTNAHLECRILLEKKKSKLN